MGVLLIAAAVLLVIMNAIPAGSRLAPLSLACFGLAVIVFERHSAWYGHRWEYLGALVVGSGVVVSMSGPSGAAPKSESVDPFRRFLRPFGWYKVNFEPGSRLPEPCSVVAIASRVEIDLTGNLAPRHDFFELMVSCWAGVVIVKAPPDWAVVAGRTTAAYGVSFAGELDSPNAYPEPRTSEPELGRLAADRAAKNGPRLASALPPTTVVVSVLGVGGRVEVAPHPAHPGSA